MSGRCLVCKHGSHVTGIPTLSSKTTRYKARQLYKNISVLFLFPVKDGKLSTGVIAIFNASCESCKFCIFSHK